MGSRYSVILLILKLKTALEPDARSCPPRFPNIQTVLPAVRAVLQYCCQGRPSHISLTMSARRNKGKNLATPPATSSKEDIFAAPPTPHKFWSKQPILQNTAKNFRTTTVAAAGEIEKLPLLTDPLKIASKYRCQWSELDVLDNSQVRLNTTTKHRLFLSSEQQVPNC